MIWKWKPFLIFLIVISASGGNRSVEIVGIVVELLVTKLVRLSFFAENKELFEPAYAIEIETIGAFMTMITSVIPTPSIRSSFIYIL